MEIEEKKELPEVELYSLTLFMTQARLEVKETWEEKKKSWLT